MGKILTIDNLNYYDFKDINITFNERTIYTIIGSNNSEKTALFRIISGIEHVFYCITCNNITLIPSSIYDYVKKIGIVTTYNNGSFQYLRVKDELKSPLVNLNYSINLIYKRINELLLLFNMKDIYYKQISELNIYEKNKLLIIIALLHQPKVLLLDSVLNIFSKKEKEEIIGVLRRIVNEGNLCIINFTTCIDEALLGDKILLLSNYKIIENIDLYSDDKLLSDNNLEIPFIVDISIKLKLYNLIKKNYYKTKDLVDDIWP